MVLKVKLLFENICRFYESTSQQAVDYELCSVVNLRNTIPIKIQGWLKRKSRKLQSNLKFYFKRD